MPVDVARGGDGEGLGITRLMSGGPTLKKEVLIASLLLCGFLGGTAVSVLSRREYWPFCYYPMFRKLSTYDTSVHYRVVGITANGERVLLENVRDFDSILPSRLQRVLRKTAAQSDDRKRAEAMNFLHGLGRAAEFPTLEIYRYRWDLREFDPNNPSRELLLKWTF